MSDDINTAQSPLPDDTENRYAICAKSAEIHGWLDPFAARRTVDILRWQDAQGIRGDLLEIGVLCGKYFAILLHAAMRSDDIVTGIDTFQYAKPDRVYHEMGKALGPHARAHMALQQCNSLELSADAVIAGIGRPRFISLDGAHDADTVHADLEIATAVLGNDGLIALNDVLNPLSPGVNEAINRFLMQPRRVVPVAFIANKLFLSHRARAAVYRAAIEAMIVEGGGPEAEDFASRARHGRHHVEQQFHGQPCLIG